MKIYIASDHRGINETKELTKYLNSLGYEVKNTNIINHEVDDYPDFALDVCKNMSEDDLGILICGNGIGMSIMANKVKGIRAARCVSRVDAANARKHNSANCLTLGTDLSLDLLKEIAVTFITTEPSTEEKYVRRTEKIINYELGEYNGL